MSKRRRAADAVAAERPDQPRSKPPVPALRMARPFKPRRGLFVALCILFAIWVAILLAMYVKTVYPQEHPAASGSN